MLVPCPCRCLHLLTSTLDRALSSPHRRRSHVNPLPGTRSQAFASPAICALASNASLSSHLALPRPSPSAASASGTPLPPSSSPPSHALFAGILAAAAAVPEIPLRPPVLNLCLSPRSGARPLGVPSPPRTPHCAPALARLLPTQITPAPSHSVFPSGPPAFFFFLPRPQHRRHHAACCLPIKNSRIYAHRHSCMREFWCCACECKF